MDKSYKLRHPGNQKGLEMSRTVTAALAVLTVFASMALAANAPAPCQVSANIATITRASDGSVTATVRGLSDFVKVGDWIMVSGVFDNTFNGGPFTLTLVEQLSGATNLAWNTPVTGTATTSGNGVVLPAIGTPNLVVQFSSSQFTVASIADPNSAYAISYGSMAEITGNGSVEKGHKVNLSGNVIEWSQPYTNGNYTFVQLCGDFPVGQNTATPGFVHLRADHFIYPSLTTVQNGDEVITVPADSVKFNLDLSGWQLAASDNRLQVQLRIKVPGQIDEVDVTRDANDSISQLGVVLRQGATLQLSFPATVSVDGTFVGTSSGYTVDAKISDTGIELFLIFPRFLSAIHWDPVVHLGP
jgi:hypothetical protein